MARHTCTCMNKVINYNNNIIIIDNEEMATELKDTIIKERDNLLISNEQLLQELEDQQKTITNTVERLEQSLEGKWPVYVLPIYVYGHNNILYFISTYSCNQCKRELFLKN